jgi:outer membrane usher protein
MRASVLACLMGLAVHPALAASALLEVSLNGKDSGVVMTVSREGDHLFVTAEDFRKLNLAMPVGAARADLAHLPGLTARVDEPGQRLLLTTAAAVLPRQLYDLNASANDPVPQSDTGAMLHYDLSATDQDARNFGRGLTGGGTFALDVFTPTMRLANSGFVTASAYGWNPVRLDSAILFERPGDMTHLILGDAISVTPAFGRAVRFGGVEWASDFGLRPGLVTQPLPSFFGQSEVPATVDVFSGAAKLYQQDVDPGPFELRNLPIVTGGGSATIVTRDVLGREISQSIALYTDAGLLAKGLQDYALDAGFLRTGYGRASFGYDTPVFSGNWRRGLADTLTMELHGEAAPGLALLGGGAEWGFGFGSLSADIAASRGLMQSFSAHALAGPFNLYGQAMLADRNYRDLAGLPASGGLAAPRQRFQAGVTSDLDWAGTFGLSWISSKYTAQPARELLSTSWSVQLPDGAFAALTGLRDFQSGAVSAQLSFNIPLGPHGLAGVSAANDNGKLSALAMFSNPADPDGGFGYRIATGWEDGGRFQGEANWIGPRVALDGGVSLDHGVPSLRADASGALVFLRGSLFAAHDPGGAVALVRTGEPNIHIYRENRPVAVSDSDGEALLTGLDAWAPNRIAVESRDYDFDALVEKTEAIVAPRAASGVVLDFTPASRHPLLATLTRGIAMAMPLGARVTLDGDRKPLPLGRDGQLFVADLQTPRGAVIDVGTSQCRVFIEPRKSGARHAPPLLCLREASGVY